MSLQPWDFATLVENQAAAVQAKANTPINFATGKTMRAWIEAEGGVGLFLQGLVVQAIALSLFATRFGQDADDWGAQFGFTRLPEKQATTSQTFTRFTSTAAAVLPVGSLVAVGNNSSQQFAVTQDTGNAFWSSSNNGYLAPIGTASIIVPIQAVSGGSSGNVLANTITQIQSQIPFDTTINAAAAVNGIDAESDPSYKARFPLFLASLASADLAAILYAAQSIQQQIDVLPIENLDYPGLTVDNGNFFLIIDDGSGDPPATLLTAITTAVNAVRAFTVRFQGAFAPSLVTANLAGTITVAAGFTPGVVVEAVDAAWALYPSSLPLKTSSLTIAGLAAVALAVPGVSNITLSSITINGVNADLALTIVQRATAGTVAVAHT